MKKNIISMQLISCMLFFYSLSGGPCTQQDKNTSFNTFTINTTKTNCPKANSYCIEFNNNKAQIPIFTSSELRKEKSPFLFGAAFSAIQAIPDLSNNQWDRWIKECNQAPEEFKNEWLIPIGKTAEFKKHYKDYIKKAASIGLTALRFSVEWSEIKPTKDTINANALIFYEDVCAFCINHGITPFVGLYHYSEPLWFWDLGSFEKEENIKYFVEFSEIVFNSLSKYEPMWLVFNTPSGIMGKRYLKGNRPFRIDKNGKNIKEALKKNTYCRKKENFALAGTVLKNVLKAHVAVYKKLKSLPNGKSAQIGFLKNIQQHDPYNPWNPLDRAGSTLANYLSEDSIIKFLRTGEFRWSWKDHFSIMAKLGTKTIEYYNLDTPVPFDFIGLNYYTHDFVKQEGLKGPKITLDAAGVIHQGSKEKIIYPEGIYRALMTLQHDLIQPIKNTYSKKIPIYITENGISAQKNHEDKHRLLFMKGYLENIQKAMCEGVDVRGYIYWSLMDCWSWGKKKHYGLFTLKNNKIILKKDAGTQYYISVISNNKIR